MQIYKEYNMNFIIFLLFPKKKKKNYIHFLKTAPPPWSCHLFSTFLPASFLLDILKKALVYFPQPDSRGCLVFVIVPALQLRDFFFL